MLYAGLDLSRQRLDVHLLDEQGRTVEVTAIHPDADALHALATLDILWTPPARQSVADAGAERWWWYPQAGLRTRPLSDKDGLAWWVA
jgi:hypothetical protein